jgi:hypothetical protein
MMWRRSLSRPGLAGLPCELDAAALERTCEDIGARGRDRDRPPAHRAGIVEKQRHHRVAEVSVLLALERQRMQRIDDHARQPRRIEQTLFQIEFPGAALLRKQKPLQAVGQPRHDALQV